MKLVRKGHGAPNALPALASGLFGSVSRLDHETLDVAVKGGAIVRAGRGQGEEIESGAGCRVAKDFHFEITNAGVNCDRHDVSVLLAVVAVERLVADTEQV